ncbi:DUF1616 domain-containing protein [Natronolimnohabitans innermongolicus]|uniref:DUF1616 domain-containing protein n=1 Tax=Natronolimnohabitans innermongolicus JCM 12255 TaxID=1227499 RepID=L9WK57_9EURY|nr:DUF1616 domain-containing protein [Natronolimnohabitans innermongolicus]ELY48748.1 hypothetical protein C493_21721 [Natronolimnohabitans innermongolicus JCM 12255]
MSHETSTLTRFGVVRQYPVDLAVVSVVAVLAYALATSLPEGSVLRLLAAFPLLLFLPGYALVSVLFPAASRNARETTGRSIEREVRGIDVVERLGLSGALSLAVVPLVGLALPFTSWGFGTLPTAAALAIITVVLAQVGVVRRLRLPAAKRFTVSPLAYISGAGRESGTVATASSLVLVLAVGLAASALLVGFLAPVSTGGFTELALYTENEDGDMVTDNIGGEIEAGDSVPVTVSIDNQEGEETEYTVVVQEQVIEDGEVVERNDLEQLETSLDDGTRGTGDLDVTPTADSGEEVRVSVLLYDGEAPEEPTNDNATEDTYFWVTVED